MSRLALASAALATSGLTGSAFARRSLADLRHANDDKLIVPGSPRWRTHDDMLTYDAATLDSTGAFLVGELERLDRTVNEPLVNFTWSRDIDMRTDVSMGDELASWLNSGFAAAGGIVPAGKNWISKDANAVPGMQLDIGKTSGPLNLWGMELSWTIPELASAMQTGRPIETDKVDGMQLKWQMDNDEQVYIGDTALNLTGLFNSTLITPSNVPNGVSGSPLWINKTPDEILADVNAILDATWLSAAYAVVPAELRLPPAQYSYLVATKVDPLGNRSILDYLMDNTIANRINGAPLRILPVKWLAGLGAGSTDRMVAYTKSPKYLRYPLVPLQRTPPQFKSIWQLCTYFGRLGVPEFRYPDTVAYADGI